MIFALIAIIVILAAGVLLFTTLGLAVALIGGLFMGISVTIIKL